MAKYKEIAEEIKKRILNGVYQLGESLPDQMNMAKEFRTSRVTIQKALGILAVEGLVYSKQGSGTYVRNNALKLSQLDTKADEYMGASKMFRGIAKVTSEIIKFDVRFPTEEECEKLVLTQSNPVYDIVRLRLVGDEPYTLEYTIMPIDVIPNLTKEVLYKSIYGYIEEDLKLTIGGMNRRIKADRSNEYDKKYLKCGEHDPVLVVEQVVYLENGNAFEYSKTRHRYDKGDIVVTSMRN